MRCQLVLAAIVLSLTGCAATQAEDRRATEGMLAAAGFQKNAADTPEKIAHLQGLTPGKILRRDRNGTPSYVYADRSVCNCLYIGTEEQYQAYRTLARERTVADETRVVDEDSSNPYSWGLWGLWP
jgi:hypothetical protein